MAEINQVDILVKADVPAIVDNQQLLVYVPVATNSNYGIVKPDGDDLIVENGILKLKEGGSVQQRQLDKKVDKLIDSSTLIGDDILKLYAQDNEGQEGYVNGSKDSLEGSVAIRTAEGTLKSQRAQEDWDLVPLTQVKEIAQENDTPGAITDATLDANIGQNAITHKSLEKWTYKETGNSEYVSVDRRIPIIAGKGIKFTKDDDLKAISIYTDLEAKLNENIIKNPEKTYLVWKGNKFPNSSQATFKAPANSTIDWGDGTIETFDIESATINIHTYTDGIEYHLIGISGLTTLPYSSFFACDSLIEVMLGESILDIGNTTFRRCNNLEKITIGSQVKSIGVQFECDIAVFKGKTPPIISGDIYIHKKIIVPKSAINDYKFAPNWSTHADKIVYEIDSSDLDTRIPETEKGEANGVATLDASGKVPSSQLPSYVDDVIDSYIVGSTPFAADWLSLTAGGSPLTPEEGKIYIIVSEGAYLNNSYRWSGTVYAPVGSPIAVVQQKGQSTEDVMSQKATTDNLNLLEAKLNENIAKDPNKTYFVWKGNQFPNNDFSRFNAPAGSTIDWGDGMVETFTTEYGGTNTHTYTDGYDYHLIVISGLTSIRNEAFVTCLGFTSAIIGNGVTSIGKYAFSDCSYFINVSIGNGVTSIGSYAFSSCRRLISITLKSTTPPTLGSDAIPTTIEKIIVPKSSINAYKSAAGWSTYADKIVYEVDSSDLPDMSKFAKLDEDNYFVGNNAFDKPILIYGNKAAIKDVDNNTFYFPANLDRPSLTYTLATTSDVDAKSSFSVEVW